MEDDELRQETGELVQWNDARGFGFVRGAGGQRLFLHISEIAPMANRPRIGDKVAYRLGRGRGGRPSAVGASVLGANRLDRSVLQRGAPPAPGRPFQLFSVQLLLAASVAVLVLLGLAIGRVPLWIAAIYAVMSLISLAAYGRDKALAQAGEWRISEASLHGLDLCGGIVGGLIGQHVFRHKTAKPSFAILTALIAALHVAALALLCTVRF